MKNVANVPLIAAAAIAAWTVLGDVQIVQEMYGAGPPYYARTTNMDKWNSPIPHLAMVNGAALLLVVALLSLAHLLRRRSRRQIPR